MEQNNSTQHTPTPWTWARQNPGALSEGEEELFFINGVAYELSKANAAFIVRACNMHDELVAALEDMVFQFEHNEQFEDEDAAVIAKARAALANP